MKNPDDRQPMFPPMSRREMGQLGWDECDVVLVSGDAYVDHPAFGPAVVARVLIDAGYRVGIVAQPDWKDPESVTVLGRPRLFFGVTAGNVDSMVANYSPGKRPRRSDDYSPGGKAGLRPDRAATVYANLVRRAYRDSPIVLGGIEASLRRLAHYDYWDDRVRGSVLLDARADVLVYGMGEKQIIEIAGRIERGEALDGVPGTCRVARELPAGAVLVPSFEQAKDGGRRFVEAFRRWHRESDNPRGRVIVQQHADRFVVQQPMSAPLTQEELDHVYDLPYARTAHPSYREPIPGFETVKFSITAHRGCLGSCTFCSLRAHQGRIIQWRSIESVRREAARITRTAGFKGHITDVGGPSANMYAATCAKMAKGMVCPDRECTWPKTCSSLRPDLEKHIRLLQAVRRVPGIKKVSVGTGIRYDLLAGRPGEHYLEQLCAHHVSGQMRVAPEHVSSPVLRVMRKATQGDYVAFRRLFRRVTGAKGTNQFLIPYFISGHPGATVDDAVELAEYLVREERFFIRQVQQFTPLPMTAAGVAYHTGVDPLTGKKLHVAKDEKEQRLQRCLLQLQEPKNFSYAERVLVEMKRDDLLRRVRALSPLLSRTTGDRRAESRGHRSRPQGKRR